MSSIVYRMVREKYANDLSGTGSALYGGRWNPKGVYVVYTSQNASLALLEWLVNATEADTDEPYCMMRIEIPDVPVLNYSIDSLPENWRDFPPPPFLQFIGSELVKNNQYLAVKVPSVVLRMESNLILNTRHSLFSQIKIAGIDSLTLDERIFRK